MTLISLIALMTLILIRIAVAGGYSGAVHFLADAAFLKEYGFGSFHYAIQHIIQLMA